MQQKSWRVSRRQVLLTVTGIAGLAGCSVLPGEKSEPSAIRINIIEVRNRDDTSHVVEVLLQRGTDLLFWDELQMKGDRRGIHTECVKKKAWEEPGHYFVRARLDDRSSWIEMDTISRARKYAYYENEFMNVFINISDSGELSFRTFDESHYKC